jgi:hypothetical protein
MMCQAANGEEISVSCFDRRLSYYRFVKLPERIDHRRRPDLAIELPVQRRVMVWLFNRAKYPHRHFERQLLSISDSPVE